MARSPEQRASRLQERRAAKSLGGHTTSASGATDSPSQKGDVRKQGQLRLECKTTSQRSYSLKRADWQKIVSQAGMFGEMPVMQIEFQGEGGFNTKLAVIDWNWFEQLQLLQPTGMEEL